MINTPFYQIPKGRFLYRMFGPALAIGCVLVMAVGMIASSVFWTGKKGPSSVIPIWDAASSHYSMTLDRMMHLPMFCVYGEMVSDFQRRQCSQYWTLFVTEGGLAFLPFLGVVLFLVFAWRAFRSFYTQVIELTENGAPLFGALVTEPARAPEDLLSWFYCLKPITVELENGNQLKVYVSFTLDPKPGTAMVGYETPAYFGQKRHVCLVHTDAVQIR